MKRTLLLMRHAKSDWKGGLSDHERPLNRRGQKDAPRMALELESRGLLPDVVRVSDAERTLETLAWMNDALGYDLPALATRRLYLPPVHQMIDVLSQIREEAACVMLLSHNPSLEELLLVLCGEAVRMTTANIAILQWDAASWADIKQHLGGFTLQEVLRPKEL